MSEPKSKPERTCPPPTPVEELRPGDCVVYQTERMDRERPGVIAEVGPLVIRLTDGSTLPTSSAYVRVIQRTEPPADPSPEQETLFAGLECAANGPFKPCAMPECKDLAEGSSRWCDAHRTIECPGCGQVVPRKRYDQACCSRRCSTAMARRRANERARGRIAASAQPEIWDHAERECEHCGGRYRPHVRTQRFCCPMCSDRWHQAQRYQRQKAEQAAALPAPVATEAPRLCRICGEPLAADAPADLDVHRSCRLSREDLALGSERAAAAAPEEAVLQGDQPGTEPGTALAPAAAVEVPSEAWSACDRLRDSFGRWVTLFGDAEQQYHEFRDQAERILAIIEE